MRVLHERASEWYQSQSLIEQAFRHALAAEDFERAAELVERSWNRLAQAGETNTVLRWLEALPEGMVRRRPVLGTWYGWTLLFKGQIAAAESRLKDAERALAEPLSEREFEVLRLICEGRSNQEIAEKLVVSLNTVKKHTSNVLGKLGVANRTQAVLRARELGLS